MNKIFVGILLITTSCLSFSESISLSGPRVGVTVMSSKMEDFYSSQDVKIEPIMTHFGWQFENKFLTNESGPEGVSVLVPLVGGFEQNLIVPSLTWLIGLRLQNGYEFGVGPNLTIGSTGVALTAGYTSEFGELYIPINLGIVLTTEGIRISFLFGFNS